MTGTLKEILERAGLGCNAGWILGLQQKWDHVCRPNSSPGMGVRVLNPSAEGGSCAGCLHGGLGAVCQVLGTFSRQNGRANSGARAVISFANRLNRW